MCRLVCTFVVRIWHKTSFCMTWPIWKKKKKKDWDKGLIPKAELKILLFLLTWLYQKEKVSRSVEGKWSPDPTYYEKDIALDTTAWISFKIVLNLELHNRLYWKVSISPLIGNYKFCYLKEIKLFFISKLWKTFLGSGPFYWVDRVRGNKIYFIFGLTHVTMHKITVAVYWTMESFESCHEKTCLWWYATRYPVSLLRPSHLQKTTGAKNFGLRNLRLIIPLVSFGTQINKIIKHCIFKIFLMKYLTLHR